MKKWIRLAALTVVGLLVVFLLLELYLGRIVEVAIETVCSESAVTRDLGGTMTTIEAGKAIAEVVAKGR